MDLYEIIGVAKSASKQQIKKAYRKKANIHHPDKGGDPAKFKALVLAYNILYDDDKRDRYDKGETAEDISKTELTESQKIINLVTQLFCQVVSNHDPQYENVPQIISKHITSTMTEIDKLIHIEEVKIGRFEKAIARIKTSSDENVFVAAAKTQINNFNAQIERLKKELKTGEGAKKFLEAYSYDVDEQIMQITFGHGMGSGAIRTFWDK